MVLTRESRELASLKGIVVLPLGKVLTRISTRKREEKSILPNSSTRKEIKITKAFITIEVDINTNYLVQTGLGEASNPQHPPRSGVVEARRGFIWDTAYEWLSDKEGFVQIKEVRFPNSKV